VPFSRTEPNVPDYVEDPNSPFQATSFLSRQFTLANSTNYLLMIVDQEFTTATFPNQIRINGVSSTDYNRVDVGGAETVGETGFGLTFGVRQYPSILFTARSGSSIGMSARPGEGESGLTVAGRLAGESPPITDLTVRSTTQNTGDFRARVFSLTL